MCKLTRWLCVFVILFIGGAFTVRCEKASAFGASQLIKGSSTAVYYLHTDGKRYVFPNEQTYKTWYNNFDQVVQISDQELASIAIGGNVTYRPAMRMVKIQTDPRVYAVASGGVLRWVTSEQVASAIYGAGWASFVDDLSDAFFSNYRIGSQIASPADDQRSNEFISTGTIGDDLRSRSIALLSSDVPKKYVSLVLVRDAAQSQYDENTWTRNIGFTENNDLQVFNVVIWGGGDATVYKKISVYKFNRTFDPDKAEYLQGGQSWVDYRERFNILNVDIPASSSSEYLAAFQRIMEAVITSQPAMHYGIKYLGHGAAGAALFAGKIDSSDSARLLTSIDIMIGNKIDFLDWDTNCGGGTYELMKSQYRFADYILASDLNRGGYTFSQPDPGISAEDFTNALQFQEPTAKLDVFFSPGKTIRQSLIDMVNSQRVLWEKTLKNNMTTEKIKQSISIYDSSRFEELVASTNLDQGMKKGDVLLYIRTNDPSQEQKFYDFRFSYVSNKDFFTWDEDSNGFKK